MDDVDVIVVEGFLIDPYRVKQNCCPELIPTIVCK